MLGCHCEPVQTTTCACRLGRPSARVTVQVPSAFFATSRTAVPNSMRSDSPYASANDVRYDRICRCGG
ncbi:hypothetical protein SAURM35S_07640 [Streptomyces aurantiogriseus]